MFSVQSVNLLTRMSRRADEAAGEPVGMDPLTIASLFLQMLPIAKALFAACKNVPQPPDPGPVPAPLQSIGVTLETWKDANAIKFAGEKSTKPDGTFYPKAITTAGKEIAKAKGIKKKAARPMAISSLKTSCDESVEDIAIAMQQAKFNAGQLGA